MEKEKLGIYKIILKYYEILYINKNLIHLSDSDETYVNFCASLA